MYSPLWSGDAGTTVDVTLEGYYTGEQTIVDGASIEGAQRWEEDRIGVYTFTHTTYTNGVAGEVLSAKFELVAGSWFVTNIVGAATNVVPKVQATGYEGVYDGEPLEWLEEQGFVFGDNLPREAYEEAANGDLDGDGYKEWEEYITGTDQWNGKDCGFTVDIRMNADGKPVLTWTPDLNKRGMEHKRDYIVEEADSPSGPWTPAQDGVDSTDGRVMPIRAGDRRYCRVKVQLVE